MSKTAVAARAACKRSGVLLALAAALLGIASTAWSQEMRGTIAGRITDQSGASVPGAKVAIANQATNVVIEVVTNLEGNYVAPFLTPGDYSVRVEREGFRSTTRSDVTLQTQARLTLDFTLATGSITETITVSGEPPMLQTASADFGQVLDTRMLNRLPVIGMNPLAIADMAPGVVPTTVSSIVDYNSSYVRVNGSSGTGNQMTIDGSPADVPRMSGVSYVMPMAQMVEELKVVTAVFDAAQGRTNGGSILVATKTGGNEFHGSAYYNFRDERFNANSWTNNYFGQPRGQENFWIAGATLNGPIIRNRTFFSAGFEKQRNIRSQTWTWRVPTELERRGDFSQTLSPSGGPLTLYDPLSTVMNPSGAFVSREVFPNTTIPASRINEVGAAVMAQYPAPNYFANANQLGVVNYTTSVIPQNPYFLFQSRVDHSLNEKHRLYGRFARNIGEPNKLDFNTLPIPAYTNHFVQSRRAYQYLLEETGTLRPTLVATFRLGFNRFNQHVIGHGDNLDPEILKLPDVLKGQLYSGGGSGTGWPRWVVNDGAMPVMGPGFRVSVNNVLSGSAGFNAFWHNHNFRWGFEYRDTRWNENNPGTTQNGQFTFDKNLTRANDNNASNNTSGSGMASLLLGLPTAGTIQRSAAAAGQSQYAALYIQDDYRILPKLTLSLGLRWEVETPFTERFDRLFYDFSPDEGLGITVPGVGALRGGVRFVNTGGLPRRQGTLDKNNFGPRIGVAYTVNSKTVVRAAWGVVYEGMINNLTDQLAQPYVPASYTFRTNYVGSGDGNRTVLPGVNISNPFPNGFNPVTGNALGSLTQLGDAVAYINPNIKLPNIHQIQFTIQRQLPWSSVAEIAYVGVRYNDLFTAYNLNEVPDAFRMGDQAVPNPFRGILPAASSRGAASTITANQLNTRFPHFTGVTEYNATGPWGRYHALQARWEKRFSHGVQVVANYTFSKNMEYDPQSLVNDRFYKTVTGSDRPHLGRVFFSGELPFGKSRWKGNNWPGWLQHVAGGWSLSWAFKYATGAPLGLSGPNGRPVPLANPATGVEIHQCLGTLGGAPCLDITRIQPLLSKYDITPEPPRYSWLRAHNRISHDAVFFKQFGITERFAFDLRAETINVFNSPLWGDPGTNINDVTNFGRITSGENPRTFRLTGRLTF